MDKEKKKTIEGENEQRMIEQLPNKAINVFPEWGKSEEFKIKLSFWERVLGVKSFTFHYKEKQEQTHEK